MVKICPKCGNADIEMVAGGQVGIWQCKKCKFRGSIFPELTKLKTKPKENNGRSKR